MQGKIFLFQISRGSLYQELEIELLMKAMDLVETRGEKKLALWGISPIIIAS